MRSRTSVMSRYTMIDVGLSRLFFLCLVLSAVDAIPEGMEFIPDKSFFGLPNSWCPVNMYGPRCDDCNELKFPADGVCQPCPAHSTSRAGAVDIVECSCNSNLYKVFAITNDQIGTVAVRQFSCVPGIDGSNNCPAHAYRDVYGTCTPCPQYSTGRMGSLKLADCVCNAGYATRPTKIGPGLDYFECIECPSGKYAESNSPTCTSCPSGAWSLARSTKIDCYCQPGYSGYNGETCTACTSGKYSDFGGPKPCETCPDSSTSAMSASSCLCKSGFSGWNWKACTPCAAGTYKESLGSAQCSTCSVNQTSPVMSTARTDCICKAGFFLTSSFDPWLQYDVFACTLCTPGKYKNVSGNQQCSNCPINTMSSSGGTDLSACQCNAGFTGSVSCFACAAGTYKTVIGSGSCTDCSVDEPFLDATRQVQRAQACQQCRPGTYQNTSSLDASCVNCPVNSTSPGGSRSFTDCVCKPGFIGNTNNCIECPSGTYAASSAPCVDKPGIVRTFEWSKTDYMCTAPSTWQNRIGYTTQFIDTVVNGCSISGICNDCCASCRAKGACNRPLDPVCLACPANSSPALTTCVCNAGFAGPNGWNCTACGVGRYSAVGEPFCSCNPGLYGLTYGICNACEPGKFSIGRQTTCTACVAGKYSTAGATTCTDCPVNSYSPVPGASIDGCECNAGFSGTSGTCVPCAAGKYKDTLGSTCLNCPEKTTSPIGSRLLGNCVCDAGHTCSDAVDFQTNRYYCSYFLTHPGQCIDYLACGACCSCSRFCGDSDIPPSLYGCTSCPLGTNKTSVGLAPCSKCPSGQTSIDGLQCVKAALFTTQITTRATPTPTTTLAAVSSTPRLTTTPTPVSTTSTVFGSVTCTCNLVCQPSNGTQSGIISINVSQYQNYMYCSWLISSNGLISLQFSLVDIDVWGDYVTINRCRTQSCSTVETLNGLYQPPDLRTIFTSDTGYIQVVFYSDFRDTGLGFRLRWNVTAHGTSSTTTTPTLVTTPIPATETTQVRTTSTTPIPSTQTTKVRTTSTTPIPATQTTQVTTTNTTPIPATQTTQVRTSSTTPARTTTTTPVGSTSTTPMPTIHTTPTTTMRTTAVSTKTPSSTTSSTTPVPTDRNDPVASSSSDVLIIIGIITSILVICCCCLVCLLCLNTEEEQRQLEYEQLELQKKHESKQRLS